MKNGAVGSGYFVNFKSYENPAEFSNHDADYVVYTDGSEWAGECGAGVIIFKDGEVWKKWFGRLPNKKSIFIAETYANGKAASLLGQVGRGAPVKIFTDCQGSLNTLGKKTTKHKMVLEASKALEGLGASRVELNYTPAHKGIHDNEEADVLAYVGRNRSASKKIEKDKMNKEKNNAISQPQTQKLPQPQ